VGVRRSHLIDLRNYEHEYPDADQFDSALELLEQR
jgi:hypothetical protein